MIHKKTLILEDNSLLPDSEVVLNIGKKESYVFEIPMNDEILKKIKPDYVADSTYVIFHLAEMSKQIQLKCKLYSNVLIIKGTIAINTAGDLIANLYLRNPNKKVVKLGDLKVKVMEEQELEVYEFEEDMVIEEQARSTNNNQVVNTIDQRLLIEAILDVKSNVKSIAQTYFEEEFTNQIGSKWYDGVGNPNNSIGIEGDYYLNITSGDIFKFTLSQWERIGNIKGDKGQDGERGPEGKQGLQGPAGRDGADGKDGLQGPQGEQGPEGKQGPQGEMGPRGLQGRDGVPGKDGAQGPQGIQGERGEAGSKWYDGIGLPTKDKGKNGDYYLNLSTEGNGDVYSKYGDIWHRVGSLGRGKRSVIMGDDEYWATVEFVTESINTALTAKVDKVEGYRLSQEDFTSELKAKLEKLEAIPGPQGEKGEKGDRGEKGETGSQGPQGLPGRDGQQGEQGIQGLKGDPGERGEVGPKGDRGEQGLPGEKGDKGVYVGTKESAPVTADIIIDDSDIGLYTIDDLTVIPIIDSTLTLTFNKYQTTTMVDNTTIVLPQVNKFIEIHLFFDTTEELTLTLPNIKWQSDINIEANKTYEFIFTYINNNWLGGCVVYNEQKVINE